MRSFIVTTFVLLVHSALVAAQFGNIFEMFGQQVSPPPVSHLHVHFFMPTYCMMSATAAAAATASAFTGPFSIHVGIPS
jgi:hypothetical protein